MKPFTFATTPTIHFGAGFLDRLGEIGAPLLGVRVLIITDAGMLETGMPARAARTLREAGVTVETFQDVTADPAESVVIAARDALLSMGATGVVGLGGGSSLDVAKLAASLAVSGADLATSYGIDKLPRGRLPLVAVPTTAGTGSEVTPIAIVTTGKDEKSGVVSPVLLPDLALLDPETTRGLPPHVTGATGIDAIVHAIESYCSVNGNNNPVSKALAREALRLMGRALEAAVHYPDNLDARSDMLLGSLLAGQAFANSPVAGVHALAYPLGGRFKVPHGLSNALVLPHVLRFNAETAPSGYAEIAPVLFPELAGANEPAFAFCDALADMVKRCGLPCRLRDIGIGSDSLPGMAKDAMKQTRLLTNNPRELLEEDALRIYKAAW